MQTIPNESTLRKNYLNDCYNAALQTIRTDIGKNYVWISVDETTDVQGRQIANLIVGKLCENENTKPHLLASKLLERTNHCTISQFVNSSMRLLWSDENFEERILLLVTDAAAYMLKAGKNLKIFYPNLKHITCVVHGLHRVAEEVRANFPNVNRLISSVKKVFLKAPLRVESYRRELGNVPLPPESILTRWGTWIEAAEFYAIHFKNIKQVIDSFDSGDAESIRNAQNIFQNEELEKNLSYIKAHFKALPTFIKGLEAVGLPLTESVSMLREAIKAFKTIPGPCGQKISQKVDSVLARNEDIDDIFKVADILLDKNSTQPPEISSALWSKYKFAPLTSCDVERSFSAYKLILTEKRHQFTTVNLEKILVIYCSLNYNKNS